ncbi:MAG: galactose-1-epimerase, partial [Clostridia bacterium]
TLYTLKNNKGAEISVSDFGALLVSVKVPDRDGVMKDVVLGYDDVEDYVKGICFFGAVIGRSGNRIANASFTLNDVTYQLAANENENNLHSNPDGYEKRVWEVADVTDQSIKLHILSPDKDQSFPGNLDLSVTHT